MSGIKSILILFLAAWAVTTGCGSDSDASRPSASADDLTGTVLKNQAPYLPPQCYTKTASADGTVHNSCYPCHTRGFKPDFISDKDLQLEYALPGYAETNHWSNLFKDRTREIAAISDDEILAYINASNYFDADGAIIPAARLTDLPEQWDYDGDGKWSGYTPDCYFDFDDDGFDRDPKGNPTGWRALAYYPFPTTHWPTNGGFGDVLIRLPEAFQTVNGQFDRECYRINLAVVEALIKRHDVAISAADETRFGVDLDQDGVLGTAQRIVYDWAPLENRRMYYVGDAGQRQLDGEVHLAAGLFPQGTEFLSTLHYLGVNAAGGIETTRRMKEIRYARKIRWLTYAELETIAMDEVKERDDFPDRLKLPIGNLETGVSNGVGWVWQGFIEDQHGDLRPQTFEETAACIGCHGGIGATTDSTFAMARKIDSSAFQEGWYHWSQKDLKGLNEPKCEFQRAGVQYEYSFYLMYAGAGDEFRSNAEIRADFFDATGGLKQEMAEHLHEDISLLLYPSKERALALNKVYRRIVAEQSFTAGRIPLLGRPGEIFESLAPADRDTKVEIPLTLKSHVRDPGCDPCVSSSIKTRTEMSAAIDGVGMAGPDGRRYQIDADGLIDTNTYAVATPGIYFPFPSRHTLPTRMIVSLGTNPVCYDCHRLPAAIPSQNSKVTVSVEFTGSSGEEKDLDMAPLTNDVARDLNPAVRPDGSLIAWESDRSGSFQIWLMNNDGSQQRQLTRGPAIHGWPRWSPDGSRLVYWGYDSQSDRSSITTIAVDGSDARVIVESEEALDRPVYSPRGDFLAWAAQTDGNWDIWASDVLGTRIRRLTAEAQMESNPLWRPDGSFIAYKVAPNNAYNLTIENFLQVENGFDSPPVRIWDGIKSIQMNDWSPDGSRIAYTAEVVTNASGEDRVSYQAVVEDIALTGEKTSGTPVILSGHNTLGDRGPVFSPDGSRIAFWSWDKSYRATLWLAAANGSNLRQLTHFGPDMTPQWHPDGEHLIFESARNGNMDIWEITLP